MTSHCLCRHESALLQPRQVSYAFGSSRRPRSLRHSSQASQAHKQAASHWHQPAQRSQYQTVAVANPSTEAGSSSSDDEGQDEMDADELKAILLDSFYGTDRGLSVSSEARAEISELITQLEAKNPNPAPTEAVDKLSGQWKLLYTINSELTGLLGLGRLPGVEVGEISQSVNGSMLSITNTVTIGSPVSRTAFSAKAAFEIMSPKRIQVRFERAVIETPQLLTDKEFPSSISFLGQSVDLTSLKDVLQPVNAAVRSTAISISNYLQNKPNLDVAIPGNRGAQSWLLTTYLDDDLRVSRGDNGAVFVLAKEAYSFNGGLRDRVRNALAVA
ncbi:TPA: prolyl aminopeptidase [Trebouxia sp. C0006]